MRRRALSGAITAVLAALLGAAASASAQVIPDTVPVDTTAAPVAVEPPAVDTIPGAQPDTVLPEAADTIPGIEADTVPGLGADTLASDTAGVSAPPDPEADAIIQELRTLPGYVPTEYLGTRAVYRTEERVLRLIGNAQVERDGNRLNADSILYRGNDDLVEAYGNPRVAGEGQDLTGEILYYDLITRRATAYGARTEVQETATWIVTGDLTVESADETRIFATGGHFTTCDLSIPHYHFEADRIKIVQDKYLVGRPARLYFGRVPVMVLPFFVQSLEQGRRSGLIVPRFSITDIVRNSGHTREITDLGWYWAINEYLGAQVTGKWRSGAYTALTGNLDYRWRRQFLNGNFAFTRYWQQSGRREFSLNGSSSWRPDERTNLSGSARFTTSSEFVRESTIDPTEATQDLNSSFNASRRFDWGQVSLGADARQSMADGGVTYTFPSFALAPNTITLFRSTSPDLSRWYNDASFQWNFRATRRGTANEADLLRGRQDEQVTDLDGGLSLNIGRLNLSTNADFERRSLDELTGYDFGNSVISPCSAPGSIEGLLEAPCRVLTGTESDRVNWNASIGYQQDLIGQTVITPNLGLQREVLRDTLTGGEYLAGPLRMNFGASLSTAIFGFIEPGFGPFSTIRHRISPTVSYSYSPAARFTEEQERAFGAIESLTRNTVTLNFNQTWEAKLREPRSDPAADSLAAVADSIAADSVGAPGGATGARQPTPQEEDKVTLLSINTSALTYDFTRARETGNGFTNTQISNSIKSDYLGGLSLQVSHDLFDRSDIDPNSPEQRGQLGRFAPRMSRLSTGFSLGPNSAIFQWLGALRSTLGVGDASPASPTRDQVGVLPGDAEPAPADRAGASGATGNPQAVGSGPWRANLDYSFSRPSRTFRGNGGLRDDRAVQTVNISASLPLTPAWSADWNTSYSITDNEFAGQRLNFSRSLHRWQANFSFFQTATGNTGFQFFVELIDNRDLQFDYRERNLGIDR